MFALVFLAGMASLDGLNTVVIVFIRVLVACSLQAGWLFTLNGYNDRLIASMMARKARLTGLFDPPAHAPTQQSKQQGPVSQPTAAAAHQGATPIIADYTPQLAPIALFATAGHGGLGGSSSSSSSSGSGASQQAVANQQRLVSGLMGLALQRRLVAGVVSGVLRPSALTQLLQGALPVDMKLTAMTWLLSRRTPAAVWLASVGLRDLAARATAHTLSAAGTNNVSSADAADIVDSSAGAAGGDVARSPQGAHTPAMPSGATTASADDAGAGLLCRPSPAHLTLAGRYLVLAALSLPQQHAATAAACARALVPAMVLGDGPGVGSTASNPTGAMGPSSSAAYAPASRGTNVTPLAGAEFFWDTATMLLQAGPHPYLVLDVS
jgi:hypothetical protein